MSKTHTPQRAVDPEDAFEATLRSLAAQSPPNCDTAISGAIEMWSSMNRSATVAECMDARERICKMFGRTV